MQMAERRDVILTSLDGINFNSLLKFRKKKRNKKKKLIFNQIFSRIKKILRTKYKIKIK